MIAFDTNVLIYSCDRSDPERQARALDLIAATQNGVLLWQVACEFVAASRKLAPQGFTAENAGNGSQIFCCYFPSLRHLLKCW